MPNEQTPTQQRLIDAAQEQLTEWGKESVKNELAARRKRRREQLRAFWIEELPALQEYAIDCIPDGDGDSDTALENVRRKLLRCKATTRAGFLSWATKQLAKEPAFHLRQEAIRRFDSYVSNFIDDAMLRHERFTTFPEHKKIGTNYFLKMDTKETPLVWIVPEEYWGFVQRSWPVFLKKKSDGYFIAKKYAGQTVPVHRLALNCEQGDTVQSRNNNFLDWGSLFVRPFNSSKIYEGQNRGKPAQKEFENRFKRMSILENVGIHVDGTCEIFNPKPVSVNKNQGQQAGCFGKVGRIGWVDPITSAENDYAPDRFLESESLEDAAKALAATKPPEERLEKVIAAQKLDALGL